jgi:nucleoside-diphosphate-sugar epimerase
MRVLVTGGSGVIGEGLIPELIGRGHQVRLLTRGADDAAREWPDEVTSFAADVTAPEQLVGAADGCDAVVHISGIIGEQPPDVTFEKVNVGGTRNVLAECARAGLPKLIFISSLAAERGSSAYHASKREAESLVRAYAGPWIILRPGNVYGPGDDVISQLLNMHRTLPAIPVIGAGDQPFQPIWYRDLGKAVAEAVDREIAPGAYEVAGTEVTTPNEILSCFEQLTGRTPLRVPVPEFLAALTTRVADTVGMPFPINESQFQMLIENNVVNDRADNDLTTTFGVSPTPLREGLAELVDIQPEQTPDEGVGGMEQKRFWADITQSRFSAEALIDQFRAHCADLMPIEFDAEPGTPRQVVEGATMTAALPLRGNIQIRVVEVAPRAVTFATLRGHPLAGVVRFTTSEPATGVVRFAVSVFARASNLLDWLAMSTVGGVAQNSTWRTVVERMVAISGGTAPRIDEEKTVVRGEEADAVEQWVGELVSQHRRATHEEGDQKQAQPRRGDAEPRRPSPQIQ